MKKRFKVVSTQGIFRTFSVVVDQETGVNYMLFGHNYLSGLTPLLDINGKPIVTPIIKK